jgi:hypothetical protein
MRITIFPAPRARRGDACRAAYGRSRTEGFVASLRELLGLIGAHEWRKKGVPVPALEARIHPHYGVFAPVRGEYVDLVAKAPLPTSCRMAFDIGTGTGVLAACWRGAAWPGSGHRQWTRGRWPAPREHPELWAWPAGRGRECRPVSGGAGRSDRLQPALVAGRAGTPLERAVYDPDSRMLQGFIAGLAAHLAPGGEGWLILSDLAEHLGLRSRRVAGGLCRAGLRRWRGGLTRDRSIRAPPTRAMRFMPARRGNHLALAAGGWLTVPEIPPTRR